jgi:hypothetical protein
MTQAPASGGSSGSTSKRQCGEDAVAVSSADGHDGVDDDRDVEGRRALARCRSCVSPCLTPQVDDQVAEPIYDLRVLPKARFAVDVSDDADPLLDAVEITELAFERGEHRERSEPRCVVPLFKSQVAADDALHQGGWSVEWPVSGDVGEPVVDFDELEVAGRRKRVGEDEAELVQPTFDSTHRWDDFTREANPSPPCLLHAVA